MQKNDIIKFLDSLSNSIEAKNIELYKDVLSKSDIENFKTPNEFDIAVLYPWQNFIKTYLKEIKSFNNEVIWIYMNYRYIENHFSSLFSNREGSACSVDKAKTLIGAIINYYTSGKEIYFNYNNEYTFHYPKKCLLEHCIIIEYYESIKQLLYGDFIKYMNIIKDILTTKYYVKLHDIVTTNIQIDDIPIDTTGTVIIIYENIFICDVEFIINGASIIKKYSFAQLKMT